ncbi:S41 family peptidase [Paraflavitalea sp. CAU 1676]|uniref:S41 family peptidase n=1 Tax=Paraflavitalea sp. CAU 1676 TaxID=3032598 RepID=UPI0023DC402C|nr:S41 family peptidase [Paraflavitalea sp. CAU 1676]MDF2191042.1 S41 family peptidase [Paraflavitalea sp. CAU 1676]
MRQWFSGTTVILSSMLFIGCASSRKSFNPDRKFSAVQLQQDYTYFRNILEESHPSLYWFTSKDSMNHYFDAAYQCIQDSMTEPQFRNLLAYVTTKIRCGHTTVRFSKKYGDYLDTVRLPVFPLHLKVWPDSMSVITNLNRKDQVLKRGTIVTHVNGMSTSQLTNTFFNYISGDGYIETGKYQVLSNRGSFGNLYRNVLGLTNQFAITYRDNYGEERETVVPIYDPLADTLNRPAVSRPTGRVPRQAPQPPMLNAVRNIQIDTTLSSAYMTVNTFGRGNKLRGFFRRSFRELKKRNIRHLVIDVRSNGGGDAGISTKLTRYLANKRFKLADSLYTPSRKSHYSKYIQWQPAYWVMMQFVTRKHKDGLYHFGYFERHYFKPKEKNHFNGDIYIITGGNSFSATTLFAGALKGQENVKIVGEETGGGAYGNSAWMIPDVTLPNSGVRFRLPRFRLVMNKDLVKEGRGIMPDIEAAPTVETIRQGIDPKVDTVRKIIMQKMGMVHH